MRTYCNYRIFLAARNHFAAFDSTKRHQWFREWFRQFYFDFDEFPGLWCGDGWERRYGPLFFTLHKVVVMLLGCGDIGVAKESRHGGKVSPACQHRRGEQMPHIVHAHTVSNIRTTAGCGEAPAKLFNGFAQVFNEPVPYKIIDEIELCPGLLSDKIGFFYDQDNVAKLMAIRDLAYGQEDALGLSE